MCVFVCALPRGPVWPFVPFPCGGAHRTIYTVNETLCFFSPRERGGGVLWHCCQYNDIRVLFFTLESCWADDVVRGADRDTEMLVYRYKDELGWCSEAKNWIRPASS